MSKIKGLTVKDSESLSDCILLQTTGFDLFQFIKNKREKMANSKFKRVAWLAVI